MHDVSKEPSSSPGATRSRWWVAVSLTLALVAASCSGSGTDTFDQSTADRGQEAGGVDADSAISAEESAGDDANGVAADAGAPVAGDEDGFGGDATEAEGPGGGTVTEDTDSRPLTAAEIGRRIILTGNLEARVEDVTAASEEAITLIGELGGFVFGQDATGGSEPRSVITFKVLPEDFDRAMRALGGVGELVNQTVVADDVTERVVNLESRIDVAQLSVERLRAALEATRDLDDFAEIEARLLARESELEIMKGELRTVQDRIDLATITLVLTQDRVENGLALMPTVYEEHDGGVSCNGSDLFRVPDRTDLTLCLEIVNIGDQTLTDVTVSDAVLGIDNEALISVFGDLDAPLEPGQSVVMAFEFTAERDIRPRIRVTAVPVDIDGTVAGPSVSEVRNLQIDVTERVTEPGFGDGFDSGKEVVAGAWRLVRIVAGFLIPMSVFIPFLAAAGWLWRRLARRRSARTEPTVTQPPPPVGTPRDESTPPAETGADADR